MLAIEDGPAHRFLQQLGGNLERPKAILVASAHWETGGGPTVSLTDKPVTIHDFGGFPKALFEIQYPVAGAPQVAEEAFRLLTQARFAVNRSASRGLDHGAWVPLRLMYPQADIPVAQISLVQGGSTEEHYRIGKALRPLRDQGVLILSSGSLTHNLQEIWNHPGNDATPSWVAHFSEWVANALQRGDIASLLDYRRQAPDAKRNHPTEEHFLPLFIGLGAADEPLTAKRIHHSHTYGILAMDAYVFS